MFKFKLNFCLWCACNKCHKLLTYLLQVVALRSHNNTHSYTLSLYHFINVEKTYSHTHNKKKNVNFNINC